MSLQTAIVVLPARTASATPPWRSARANGKAPHMVWHGDSEMPKADLIVLPGGFPTAIICAPALWRPIRRSWREVKARAKKGTRLGYLQRFQILCEAQMLPASCW